MKKQLILVASPPACGKTYVSKLIAKSLDHIVYLDKDDLSDIVRAGFAAAGQELDMDGSFYIENLRSAEYSTILNIAFSTLQFEDRVILNAPFGKEVRDNEYIKILKDKANQNGADLLLIWVTVPESVCYERMKTRDSERDTLKLKNWDEYVSKINYNPPYELEEKGAVDKLIVFNNKDDASLNSSLKESLKIILGE